MAGKGRGDVKRVFDTLLAIVGLIVLLPVIAITALLVWVNLGRPILFRQTRPGRYGEPFELIKFRTMRNISTIGEASGDESRITRFGKFLRSSSLDELPELWNVLKGDMSLVGPRPLLMEYLALYDSFQRRRHEVRPGLTGWAQVNGRNALTWGDKFALDVWYIDNRGFFLDCKILLLTIGKVFRREGVGSAGSTTAKRFRGN